MGIHGLWIGLLVILHSIDVLDVAVARCMVLCISTGMRCCTGWHRDLLLMSYLPAATAVNDCTVMMLQVATSVQAVGLGVVVSCFDWAVEARKAAKRVAASKLVAVQDEEEAIELLREGDRY
jgi:hypothetical protein